MKVVSGGRETDLCFMSPTWRGDLDRFALLRESLCVFGHGAVPHYALVNSEDRDLLERLKLPGVIALTTSDLLPAQVEARRIRYNAQRGGVRWKRFQRSLYKRLGWFPDARYYGWQIQQLLKLAAPPSLPHEVVVSFDSDLVVTGDFSLECYVPGGQVVLYERYSAIDPLLGPERWYANACRLLDAPQLAGRDCDHVAQPFVFERRAVVRLHAWLEHRYQRPWHEVLIAEPLGAWSEFMIYGVFVRHHLKMDGFVSALSNDHHIWLQTEEQRRRAPEIIAQAFDDPDIHYLVLQADDHGRWPLDRFVAELRPRLAQAAALRNSASRLS